jgi:hypothetical protein
LKPRTLTAVSTLLVLCYRRTSNSDAGWFLGVLPLV